jgi:hypothetical protein
MLSSRTIHFQHPFVPCKTRTWVMRRNLSLSLLECMSGEGVHFTFSSNSKCIMICMSNWRVFLKDRRRRPEGGEWEPIKISRKNLTYISKSAQRPSLITWPRPLSYSKAVGPRNRVRNLNENTRRC